MIVLKRNPNFKKQSAFGCINLNRVWVNTLKKNISIRETVQGLMDELPPALFGVEEKSLN